MAYTKLVVTSVVKNGVVMPEGELPLPKGTKIVFIVPLTSALNAAHFPGTLIIQPDPLNGLTKPSVALVFQMRSLDKRRLFRCIGKLEATTLSQIWSILDSLSGR